MISIANKAAAAFLRRDLLKHLEEVVHLELNLPPFPIHAYADAKPPTAVMLVSEMPYGVNAFLSRQSDVFTTASLDYLSGVYDKFSLRSVDCKVFEAESLAKLLEPAAVRCYPSLACTALDTAPARYHQCRRLSPNDNDRDLFIQYQYDMTQEAYQEGRPNNSQIFESLVIENEGEIYAVEEDYELAGYLTCYPDIDNVWDVEFIHVREDKRNQGIGEKLAGTYARERLARGEIAYYSSPANRASERVAEKAGFTRCRTLFCAELDTKQ